MLQTIVVAINKMNCHILICISRSHIWRKQAHLLYIFCFESQFLKNGAASSLRDSMALTWYCRTDSFKVLWVTHCHAVWKSQHFTQFFNGECNLQRTSPANKFHTTNSAMGQCLQSIICDVSTLQKSSTIVHTITVSPLPGHRLILMCLSLIILLL